MTTHVRIIIIVTVYIFRVCKLWLYLFDYCTRSRTSSSHPAVICTTPITMVTLYTMDSRDCLKWI